MVIELKDVEGFRELERALAQLNVNTAKNIGRRSMRKELKPIAEMANAFWPGANDQAFRVTSALKRTQPRPKQSRTILNMFVGSSEPQAHLLEFGTGPRFQKNGRYTGSVSPLPMLQPAWDSKRNTLAQSLGKRIGDEIQATLSRLAKRG